MISLHSRMVCQLSGRLPGELCGDKVLVGGPLFQLPCILQDILEKIEAVLREHQIVGPCVLVIVAGHNGGDGIQVRLLKLRSDDARNLLRGG